MILASQAGAIPLHPNEDAVPDAQTAVAVGAAFLSALLGKEDYQALIKYAPVVDGSPLEAELDGDTWSISARPSPLLGKEQHNPDGSTTILVQTGGTELQISKHDGRVLDLILMR